MPDSQFEIRNLKFLTVKQSFPRSAKLDVRASLRRDFKPAVKSGARIAVAVGSRGISNLVDVVREVVAILKEAGAQPFIVPAMGSHGGATAEGQAEILAGYGISEATTGAPVRPSMEVEVLGTTEEGIPVNFSREAFRSDGVVVVNRVKPHTDFVGKVGSGVLKMIGIGLGKQAGAAACHAAGQRFGLEKVIKTVAGVSLRRAPILFGIALVEDAHHETARIAVVPRDEIEAREAELAAEARRLMPRLPFEEVDLLIVDRIGKNITGAGMDPNIIGRAVQGYSSALSDNSRRPNVKRILVLDVTPESHGNVIGIGMADFTTARLTGKIDRKSTYMNALTSLSVQTVKIPITFDTDREAVEGALGTLALPDPREARVIRIRDTLALETVQISEAYKERNGLQVLDGPREFSFDASGSLLPFY